MKKYAPKYSTSITGLFLLVISFYFIGQFSGCGGGDDTETITLDLVAKSLDFDSSNNLYIVEETSSSLWKFIPTSEGFAGTGILSPTPQGGFSPWGLSTDARAEHDILFVTDTTEGAQRLLALNKEFTYNIISDTGIILAEISTFGSGDSFIQLRAAAAYTIVKGGNILRVFVADNNRVVFFDYNPNAQPPTPKFEFKNKITLPADECLDAFVEPYGMAVDRDNDFLYVVDNRPNQPSEKPLGILYRFINASGTMPYCMAEVKDADGKGFIHPQGITVLAGQAENHNKVIVADSGNDRIVSFIWDGTSLDFSKDTGSLDNPFDLAVDSGKNLWITYPSIKNVGVLPPGSY